MSGLIYHRGLRLILMLSLVIAAQSCEWEQREPLDESDLPETVSLSEHVQPIFTGQCIQCHDGTTPPNLLEGEAYIELTGLGYINTENPEESKLYEAIDVGGSMYQYAGDIDRAMILKWITQGAEEN